MSSNKRLAHEVLSETGDNDQLRWNPQSILRDPMQICLINDVYRNGFYFKTVTSDDQEIAVLLSMKFRRNLIDSSWMLVNKVNYHGVIYATNRKTYPWSTSWEVEVKNLGIMLGGTSVNIYAERDVGIHPCIDLALGMKFISRYPVIAARYTDGYKRQVCITLWDKERSPNSYIEIAGYKLDEPHIDGKIVLPEMS